MAKIRLSRVESSAFKNLSYAGPSVFNCVGHLTALLGRLLQCAYCLGCLTPLLGKVLILCLTVKAA